MSVNRMLARKCAAVLLVLCSLSVSAFAGTSASAKLANIRIDNFGMINENYYRGAQPDRSDYADLAALGIKTVIDLTRDGKADEKGLVERTGMKFYRIPLTTSDAPTQADVTEFMRLVSDPANQPVYVHCQGGRHRTGVMTAVYRMTQDHWNAERAYTEMKKYKFEGFPGHPALKNFVYAFYAQLDQRHLAENERRAEAGATK